MRNCPVCDRPLIEMPLHGQIIDRCDKCKGLFLDEGELDAISEMVEIFDEVKIDEPEIDTVPKKEVDREVVCPADGTPMTPTDLGGVIVDTCDSCGGIWLDGGELAAIKIAETNIKTNLNLYIRLGK
jgi:Zn-finger nucleic acid-binding protein